MIKSVRWVGHQAAIGLRDLSRNSSWLLSKAVHAPSAMTRATGDGITDSVRRMTVAAADSLPGVHDAVEVRLKRAEMAIAKAKQAEQDALAEAQRVKALADAARVVAEAGNERVRQAVRDAEEEVERRTQAAREHFAQLVDNERGKASRETADALERLRSDVRAATDKARDVAQAAAEAAQHRINSAQQQMEAARSLAAEATAAAERVASEVHEHAKAITEDAQQRAGAADAAVDKARRTQEALSSETPCAGAMPVPVKLADNRAEII